MFKENDGIGILFAMFCICLLFLFGLWIASGDSDKQKKQEYEFETYYDEDSGITMRIFKDGLGDVLWCEPIEAEMEVNE